MNISTVAELIETQKLHDSSVHKYLGNNVKSPGLVKGQFYIIKYWSLKSVRESDNVYWVGQFLGAGFDHTDILNDTPRAKELSENQKYFFKRVNESIVAAGNFNGSLVIGGDPEQRITFYALLQEPQENAQAMSAPAARTVKERAVKSAVAPREHKNTRITTRRSHKQTYVEVTSEELDRTLRIIESRVTIRRNYLVATFKESTLANSFMKEYKESELKVDGSLHIVSAPEDKNPNSDYFDKAKKIGANQIYNHNRIVY